MKESSPDILDLDGLEGPRAGRDPVALRTGSAGFVYVDADGTVSDDLRLRLSANSTYALLGHGVVDALNALPLQGTLGRGRKVLIPPRDLEAARELFYRADARTYGRRYEFVVDGEFVRAANEGGPETTGTELRIRIDNREYQNTLSGLQYLLRTASHEGLAAWILI